MHPRFRFLLVVSGVLLLAACQDRRDVVTDATSAPTEPSRARATAPGQQRVRVLLRMRSGNDRAELMRATQAQGGVVLREYRRFPLLSVSLPQPALDGLRRSPMVLEVIEDIPDAPTLDTSLVTIGADQVHALGWTGAGQTIVVLDDGIDRTHPFFQNRVTDEACFSTAGTANEVGLCPDGTATQTGAGSANNAQGQCLNGTDQLCDHGAHVAGIAAGNGVNAAGAPLAGVAPDANIIGMQVFVRNNSSADCSPRAAPCVLSYPSDQVGALERILDLYDGGNTSIVAVNMSLGGGMFTAACDNAADNGARKAPIDALLSRGIATVIAAGNNGFGAAVGRPACISTAITVGNTLNNDAIAGTSNRGVLLDVFAPGTNIFSSVASPGYGFKSGTSMAAPHVAGAWAVLREAEPTLTVAQLLQRLQNTGVPIAYMSGGSTVTTPRIDLLAALAAGSAPPVLTRTNATITVNEGSTATNTGTVSDPDGDAVTLRASVGTVVLSGSLWSWSWPTTDGPADGQVVTITATDSRGATGTTTFTLVVQNVAPTVTISPNQLLTRVEGQSLLVSATFTDPGVADAPFYATIVCYDVPSFGSANATDVVVTVTSTAPAPLRGTVTGTCPYGDRGTFTGSVAVEDKNGDRGSAPFTVAVSNVAPTTTIGDANATLINGVPTVIGQIGQPIDFEGTVTDPGSDDLQLLWNWQDGTTTAASYLNDGPGSDPYPSPSMNARDITDVQAKTWMDACYFSIELRATDDDAGTSIANANVVITGNSGRARSSGYWQTQYRSVRNSALGEATLQCYLDIAAHLSVVFGELRNAGTLAQAGNVLQPRGNSGDTRPLLEQQLLAAWINFANGAFGWHDLVDTNRDGVPDTAFSVAVMEAEATRANPASTRAQLESAKNRMESVNLMHGG